MINKLLKYLILFSIVFFLLYSCKKKNERPYWNTGLLVPLLDTEIKLQKLSKDNFIGQDADKILHILYDKDLFEYKLDELVQIPDTQVSTVFKIPVNNYKIPPGVAVFPDTSNNVINLQDMQLSQARIRSGKLAVEIVSTLSQNIILDYKIPFSDKDNGIFAVQKFIAKASLSNPTRIIDTIDLSGVLLNLRGKNQNIYNTFFSVTTPTVDPSGDTLVLNSSDYLAVNTKFIALIPEYAHGFFGQRVVEEAPDTESFDFFNNVIGGSLLLDKATIKVEVENSIGADFRMQIKELSSINKANKINLTHPLVGNFANITRATKTSGVYPPIKPSYYNFEINDQNSNIAAFLSNLPNALGYQVALYVNPLGNVSSGNDFLYFNTGIKLNLKADIPLRLRTNNLVLTDTAVFSFGNEEENRKVSNQIEGGYLNVEIENAYPFDAGLQLILLNDKFQPIDSLFSTEQTALSAHADANGKTLHTTKSTLKIIVNQSLIDNMYKAAYINTRIKLNTKPQDNFVNLYSDQYMRVQLVGDFDVSTQDRSKK
jgi:hypothetical protein